MIIRLALVKPEAVILQPRDGHPGAVRLLDPHGRILHHKALVLPDSENIRRVVIELRVWFALLELFSADDEVKFRAHANLFNDPGDQLWSGRRYKCDDISPAF